MEQSATYDFLLMLHSNYEPILHRFRDKWRFQLKIANFSHPVYLTPHLLQCKEVKTSLLIQNKYLLMGTLHILTYFKTFTLSCA